MKKETRKRLFFDAMNDSISCAGIFRKRLVCYIVKGALDDEMRR